MQVLERIDNDFTQALKDKRQLVLLTLRSLKAAIKNAEIAKRPKELEEGDVALVARSEIKKREEAAVEYARGGRQDLADRELEEVEVLKKYAPPEMSGKQVREVVEKVIQELGASTMKDFGAAMKGAMKELKGKVDGKKVGEMVKTMLDKKTP